MDNTSGETLNRPKISAGFNFFTVEKAYQF